MARPRPAGWWYPWSLFGGLAVVVAVNAVLVTFAITTFPGLQTTDHYNKGLAYNDNLAGARAQAARGWQLSVEFAPEGRTGEARAARLSVRLIDRHGVPLDRLEVEAAFIRPTSEGHDQTVVLDYAGDGRYAREVSLPLPGVWDARIVARRADVVFQETRRLFVP